MTKSQRRVWRRWQALGDRLKMTIAPVSVSPEKVALYNRHKLERKLVATEDGALEISSYVAWLVHSCFETVEICYSIDETLIGVGILDLGAEAASSVYFYFEPSAEVSKLSPGVFSVLQEILFCRMTQRKYYYLGLYVSDCPRLNYKANYGPHERLIDGVWSSKGDGAQKIG
jgi:arginyl-tRNA--protein-N-Asp/Glu arginylyltransferase